MPTTSIALLKDTTSAVIGHPTWDLVLVGFFIAAGLFYGIMAERKKLVSTLLIVYVAIAVLPLVPVRVIAAYVNIENPFYAHVVAYIAVLLILYFAIGERTGRRRNRDDPWWVLFGLSFLQIGLMLHTVFGFLPATERGLLAPFTRLVFASPSAGLWWLVLPLVFLFLLKRRDR